MTVGFFSPLPPTPTGVADYAASLLRELRKHGTVEIDPRRCDVALYQVGNNALHAAIYRRALEEPGVVVLHDAMLHHFLLGQLDEPAYIDEFVYNYGEWNRGLARDLWLGRAASGSDARYFSYPMLRRIVERSLAVVVHNPAAADVVKRHVLSSSVTEIPHLFEAPRGLSETETIRFRQRIGVPPKAFLFGVFGYLRESKRLLSTLEAFCEVQRNIPHAALLVAGDFVSTDLARAVQPLLSLPGVIRLPHLSERDFWLAAKAVDACINLKYPAAGETSGICIRLMGIGKPVIVTDSPECARFPEDAVIRIPPGPGERESLREHMILLSSLSEAARIIGQRGAEHIQERHRVDRIGVQYWQLLCEQRASSQP